MMVVRMEQKYVLIMISARPRPSRRCPTPALSTRRHTYVTHGHDRCVT